MSFNYQFEASEFVKSQLTVTRYDFIRNAH